jgi:predicted ribosome quality control (RQC) complex YloA/Tae2 family protein
MSQLEQELAKKQKLLRNVEGDLMRAQQTLLLEHDANLLIANMHLLKRGMKEAVLMDYTLDPPAPRTMTLDEKLSPQDFVAKMFKSIKRAKRGIHIIANRLDEIRESIKALEQDIVNAANNSEQPDSQETSFTSKAPSKHKEGKRLPFHQFISHDGVTIWVGRSAKDSDDMLRIARGNSWFFHARDVPGAHVIVKTPDNLTPQTVLEAALLAHHFSKSRNKPNSVIQYTRVKYVHKKKGLPPGKVIITQEKTLEIDVDKAALKKIITRER